ncbi:protein EARLY-RESPONSIVE TO DEHYDRATION 7, chloroplastic-like [Primulina huaijiensis]|uniref:protein EARLY-RESPONSIVE TO DEHYDRATION 7, chloroplastic-like n=1 Tax=Primulina huaijiensis TaxID=1492673 RepID=UPI003CC7481F
MSSKSSKKQISSLYPEVIQSNPDSNSPFASDGRSKNSSSSSLYPSVQMEGLEENLFAEEEGEEARYEAVKKASSESSEEVLIRIPGAIVHLIDKERSVELASGEFSIIQLRQGDNYVAALARMGEEIQWPLAKDEAAVKLDESHYFFTLRIPNENYETGGDNILNYGLTIASKGQEPLLRKLDSVLEKFSAFKVEKASEAVEKGWLAAAKDVSPAEMEGKKDELERSASAYWTTLAPNVEDYSGSVARMIAAGSGQVVRGILWCGDVTTDRLKWGNDFLKKRMTKGSSSEVSPQALRRMKRVKQMTKMSENVALGILSGVVKVSGFFTSPVANSKVGQKFFSILPGEIILASLEGFNKVCDAVEVAGKNVMSTTSVVTTGLVSHKYGEQAAEVTRDGLGAAGHAFGTAWAVFKIRKALNPKSVMKPSSFMKAAAKANSAKLKANPKNPTISDS